MLVRVAGDNIMICPPFIITPQEIDEVSKRDTNIDTLLKLRTHSRDQSCLGFPNNPAAK